MSDAGGDLMRPQLTLTVILLAGCLSSPPSPLGTSSEDDGPSAEVLPAFATMKVGAGGDAEASITIGPDGTILVCSHGGFTQPSPVWVSEDNGQTFRRLDPQPTPFVSGDCDVAITDDGAWYVAFTTTASVVIGATSDRGGSWRFDYAAAVPVGVADRPWLRAVGNELYMTYADLVSAEPFVGVFQRSPDGGRTWTGRQVFAVPDAPERLHCTVGQLAVAGEGATVRVPLDCTDLSSNTNPHWLQMATSRDGGASWTRETIRGAHLAPFRIPSLTYAGQGRLFTSYAAGPATDADIAVQASLDDGESWSDAAIVTSHQRFEDVSTVWIDGRPEGTATLAWLHNTRPANASGGQAWQVSAAGASLVEGVHVSEVAALIEPHFEEQVIEFLMVRHDASGTAHIVFPMGGEGCSAPPPNLPNPRDRNRQCVWLASGEPREVEPGQPSGIAE